MGIKNLFKFLRTQYPHAIETQPVSYLSGKTLYVDTSCLLYKYMVQSKYYSKSEKSVKAMVDSEGNKTSHLRGIASMIRHYSSRGIDTVFVMDGKPSSLKSEEAFL
jgi:hypothetical protein